MIALYYSYTIKKVTVFELPPIFRILIVLVMLVRYENEKTMMVTSTIYIIRCSKLYGNSQYWSKAMKTVLFATLDS